MTTGSYRGRKGAVLENDQVRVTVLHGGGHIAEILHKPTGVNPLWTPPWPSIEPAHYNREARPEYGASDEAWILSGIMGHSICLDTYGAPSPEEMAAGVPIHGEGPTVTYELEVGHDSVSAKGVLPLAQLAFRRDIRIDPGGEVIRFTETLENLSPSDRPVAWTQHVTLGPPFLEPGRTQFRAAVTRSRTAGDDFTGGRSAQEPDAYFEELACPRRGGGIIDLRVFPADGVSGGFTTHLVDPEREDGFFAAWSPTSKVLFGYTWKRKDFPWLCRWEENHMRTEPPWNGQALACGMEFGVSPMLESRRDMVRRGSLFGERAYRWLPAKAKVSVQYSAFLRTADAIPDSVDGKNGSLAFR